MMKKSFFTLLMALITTTLWASNTITYKATEKLTRDLLNIGQTTFGPAITSHTFNNGTGTITCSGEITTIGYGAFEYCSSLTSVTIPNSVTTIEGYVFFDCQGLTSINVDATNTHYCSVDGVLFNYAKNTLIEYPEGNTRTTYTIPNSVTTIKTRAFEDCKGLTSVTIPNSVTTIGNYAFTDCSGLTSVTIPNSVTTIGERAFDGCSGLTSVTIPNSVTEIGYGAFTDCSGLTSVTIPNSVTTIEQATFRQCLKLISITIPNSVTTIGNSAFTRCSLTSVTIPNSVTSIGNTAFYYCSDLTSVTIKATTPPSLGSGVWSSISSSCVFYIPCGTKAAYQQAWGEEYNFVEMSFCETVQCTVVNESPFGTVSFTGEVVKDSEIALKATAPECSQFIKWSDNNTDNPRSVEMTQDSTFTAIFEKINFTITLDANPEQGEVVEETENQ